MQTKHNMLPHQKAKFLEYLEKKKLETTKKNSNGSIKNQDNFIFWLVDDIISKLKKDEVLNKENKAKVANPQFADALLNKILQDSFAYTMDNPARTPDTLFENSLKESANMEEVIFKMNVKAQQDLDFSYILNKSFCLSYIEQAQSWGVEPDPAIVALLFN